MSFQKCRVALIGSGMISGVYLENLKSFDAIELVGCSDIVSERAKKRAEEFGIAAMTNEEILNDPEIELVVNTTYPLAHYDVAKQCLLHGKHVYTEKLIVETLEQARELQAIADERGLFFGGAPDTWLGGSAQLAKRIIESGLIGTPTMVDATLFRSYHNERFSTSAEKRFSFCRHGGIIFDMGAYYLSHMAFLLGPIAEVSGMGEIRNRNRVYENPQNPACGEKMTVESWNNVTGSLKFKDGVFGHLTVSAEGSAVMNRFLICGTDGTLDLGDPNEYEDHVTVTNKSGQQSVIYTPFGYHGKNYRGIGVLDAVYALRNGRKPRTSGAFCTHVLEAANGICESIETQSVYRMTTTIEPPKPLPVGYTEYPELVFTK